MMNNNSQRVHVGGYEAWVENGMLALHYHKAGRQNGTCVKMSPDETMGLLELLLQNKESVYNAAGGEDFSRRIHELHEKMTQEIN